MTRPADIPQDVWDAADEAASGFFGTGLTKIIARAIMAERERSPWQSIEHAPKDRPLMVYYDHAADPYYDPENPNSLTAYAANADAVGHVSGAGQIVAMWCDGYHEDDGYEDPTGGYWVPGGWFLCVNGEPQDTACNALFWRELDANPQAPITPPTGA